MNRLPGRRGWGVRSALAVALIGAVAALPGPAAGGRAGPVGAQRLLVLPVTWGPRPWSIDEIRAEALDAASVWVRSSSYGRAWLTGSVSRWLDIEWRPDDCDAVRLATTARAAASRAGVELRGYDRVAFLQPRGACPWSGFAGAGEFWLNGTIRAKVVVHELGHTWGLDHANALVCEGGGCHGVEYGDPYSPMGRGFGDFTAFEKFRLGWITDLARARPAEPSTVELAPVEQVSALPQAFVAPSAAGDFWFEYRNDAHAVVVHANATPSGQSMAGQPNLFVSELRAGERFAAGGAFVVAAASLSPDAARLEFAWADRVAPRAPVVSVPGKVRGARVVVRWRGGEDRGSGLDHFDVSLDGARRRVVPDALGLEQRTAFPLRRAGRHSVVVTAVDRAGNRSSARRAFTAVGVNAAPPRPRVAKVDVGGYRLLLECRGAGGPTVVFDSGANETGGSWTPIHPAVARETRACSYDRAGLGGSDPRPGPEPATNATIAEELFALLTRARVPGPYVLVGHSLGGIDIRLFAARHPAATAGLVFVDGSDPDLLAGRGVIFDGAEPLDLRPAAVELRDARFGSLPTVVLFANARRDLAAALGARSTNSSVVFAPNTGHHIHQERPRLAIEAVRQVVRAARTSSRLPVCSESAFPSLGGECVEVALPR